MVPKYFDRAIKKGGEWLEPVGEGAACMMEAIRNADDSIFGESSSGRLPNGWAFVIPKNALRASFIFHLVWLKLCYTKI